MATGSLPDTIPNPSGTTPTASASPRFEICITTWKSFPKATDPGALSSTESAGGVWTMTVVAGEEMALMLVLEKVSVATALTLKPRVPAGEALQAQLKDCVPPATSVVAALTTGVGWTEHAVEAGATSGVSAVSLASATPVFVTCAVRVNASPTDAVEGVADTVTPRAASGDVETTKAF